MAAILDHLRPFFNFLAIKNSNVAKPKKIRIPTDVEIIKIMKPIPGGTANSPLPPEEMPPVSILNVTVIVGISKRRTSRTLATAKIRKIIDIILIPLGIFFRELVFTISSSINFIFH